MKLNKHDLIKGEIYYGEGNCTHICEYPRGIRIVDGCRLSHSCDLTWMRLGNLRLATSEEKRWLDACIKADDFIPKSDAIKETIIENFNLY